MADERQQVKKKGTHKEKVDIMAQNIYDWATNEMNCMESCSSMPSVGDLKDVGPMMDVFSFITKHVKSKQTVQKIRYNARLHSSISDADSNCKKTGYELIPNTIKALDTKKYDLETQLKEKKKFLAILKNKVMNKTIQCNLKEESGDELMKAFDDANERKILFEAQSSKTREKTDDLWRHDVLLGEIIERCEQRRDLKPTTYVERDGNIISICMQDVQDSCKAIEKSVECRIDSDVADNQVWAVDNNIIETVRETIETHNESEIMECLVESAKKTIECKSDICDDSQIQFSSKLQSQKLLQINTFVKTKESQIETHNKNKKVEETVKSIERNLVEMYKDDDKSLNTARQVVLASIQEAKLKGQIEYLRKESVCLDEKLPGLEEECKSLTATYESIFLEDDKVKKKQEAVLSYLSSFEEQIALLDTKRQEVKEMVSNSFGQSKLDEMCNHLRQLRNATATDVESLLTLPLNDVVDVDGGDVTSSFVSTSGSDFSRKDATSLSEIVKLKEDVRHNQQLVDSQTYMMESIVACEGEFDSDHINSLSDSITKVKADKTELLMSNVQDFLQTMSERVSETQTIKDTVQNWWEQPAQNIDLGLTVDNKSIKEWIHD